jgi:hypothetical protein
MSQPARIAMVYRLIVFGGNLRNTAEIWVSLIAPATRFSSPNPWHLLSLAPVILPPMSAIIERECPLTRLFL